MNKPKNPHAVALGRKGGLNSGGKRPGAGRKPKCGNCGRADCKSCKRRKLPKLLLSQ